MNKLRKLLAAFCPGMLATPFSAFAQQQGKVWRIGFAPFASPLCFLPGATPDNYRTLDGNGAQGAMIDLHKAIAKDAGYQIQFIAFVAGELTTALGENKIDIRIFASSNMPQQLMNISELIFNDSEVLIANKADTTPYASHNDLKGLIIGSRTGTVSEDALKANGFTIKSYAAGPDLFKAVETGEVKVAINTAYIPTANILSRGEYPNVNIVRSYKPALSSVLGIGVRKSEGDLLRGINTSLKKLKADGTVRAIFAKYGIAEPLVN